MKTVIVMAAAAFLFVLVSVVAPSQAIAQGEAGPKDYARGSGFVPALNVRFSFNAESDPAGGSPKGTMRYSDLTTGLDVTATVTCLVIRGSRTALGGGVAGIGGDITKASGPLPELHGFAADGLLFSVTDFGERLLVVDTFGAVFLEDGPPERLCEIKGLPEAPIEAGEITLTDE
jgi:hypothetical protein